MNKAITMAVSAAFVMGVVQLRHVQAADVPATPATVPATDTMTDKGITTLTGTVTSVRKSEDGVSQIIEVKDAAGVLNSYTVGGSVEVKDANGKTLSLSKVKEGSNVSLSMDNGQVSKITVTK